MTDWRRRGVILGLVASFLLPFVFGTLAYERGWFRGGATNHGELIQPPLALSALARPPVLEPGQRGRWLLIQVDGRDCDATCAQGHATLHRLQAGLGRERERVAVLTLAADATLAAGHWYIADPQGWIMLRYAIPADASQVLPRVQDVLDDLKKLLKVSRIG